MDAHRAFDFKSPEMDISGDIVWWICEYVLLIFSLLLITVVNTKFV
jgi:hypothetical protein